MNKSKTQSDSLYDVLGLKRDCTSDEVAEAWKVKKQKISSASAEHKLIENAYKTLSDPVFREMYNKFKIREERNSKPDDFYFFSDTYLENKLVKDYKKNLLMKDHDFFPIQYVTVPLEDLYNGRSLKVNVTVKKVCTDCPSTCSFVDCPQCKKLLGQALAMCPTCHGNGLVPHPTFCTLCRGSKRLTTVVQTMITIEKGMLDGEKVLTSDVPQAINLPKTVTLKQSKHNLFARRGDDLYFTKQLSITEALCGCRFAITHLDNRKLIVTSPSGIVLMPGCKKVIQGRGMPINHSKEVKYGDLIVLFNVNMPNKLDIEVQKDMKNFLPEPPVFKMPSNPETEEYQLTKFDPSYKLQSNLRNQEAYFDEKHDKAHGSEQKNLCAQQ